MSDSKLAKGNKQTQEAGTNQDISTASKNTSASISKPIFQFMGEPTMDYTVDDSLYARFKTWKLRCKNTLETELVSLPDTKECKILLRWLGDQGLGMYQAPCLEPSEISAAILT